MPIPSTIFFALAAGTLTAVAAADVVIQPTAVPDVSTWRSCVPPVNIYNGNGLTNAGVVAGGSAVPAAWPTHGINGCDNMWHTSCLGQTGTTCEGGPNADLMPYIVFDLGAAWDLTGFHLWNHNQMPPGTGNETDRGIRNIEVQVSTDGVNFSSPVPFNDVARAPGNASYAGIDLALPAENVRFVRFQVLSNWGATGVTGMSEIRFIGNSRLALTSPAVSPPTVNLCGPQNVVVSARVVPAANADVVNVVLSGGPTTGFPQLNDEGVDGDDQAGDGVYSATVTFPGDYPLGVTTFTIATEDTAGHSSTTTVDASVEACIPTYNETDDAGSLPEFAGVANGSGTLERIRGSFNAATDVDFYKITICEPIAFSATTVGGTAADTRLWIFNLDGTGVVFNDDEVGGTTLQSRLTSLLVPPAGDYYLVIAEYPVAPADGSNQILWSAATPFRSETAPNGPGAANPVAAWNGTGTFGPASYLINLTGVCFVQDAPPACPADIGVAGGLPGQDGLLDNNDFIAFITYFFNQDPIADMGVAGGLPGSDGLYDNNDFIAFITHFFDGCP